MVDEIAIVGRPLVDAAQMQSKVGERVFVGLCMHAAAAAPASGNNAVARKLFEYELIVYMLDVGG
jgi:hypothetical protein